MGLVEEVPGRGVVRRDTDVLNPRGSGYYAVIKMDLAPHSSLYKDLQIRSVIPCKEQLLNRYT